MENGPASMIYLVNMVIFHSYVSLPEGIHCGVPTSLSMSRLFRHQPRSRPAEDTHSAASWDVNDL